MTKLFLSRSKVSKLPAHDDMNSNEFTAYKDLDAQKRGEIVWPEFDVDPNNITGVEGAETPVAAE